MRGRDPQGMCLGGSPESQHEGPLYKSCHSVGTSRAFPGAKEYVSEHREPSKLMPFYFSTSMLVAALFTATKTGNRQVIHLQESR